MYLRPNDFPLRDFQTRYIVPSAVMVALLMAIATVYEVWGISTDSWEETAVAVVRWTSPSLATTTIILIAKEVLDMVTRRRYIEEGRQEGRRAWKEWLARREAAEKAGQPFTELSPADNDRASA